MCVIYLYVKDSRFLSQLSKLQVSSVVPISRQEVEPVNLRWAAQVMSVSQVQPVQVHLGEPQRGRQRDSSQQQFTVARWLCDDKAQVGCGRVGVSELQMLGRDGLCGAVLQPEAHVAVEGGGNAVAVLDGEVEGAAARRVAVGDNETVKTKL